jgi:hypothetical protein
VVLPTDKTNCNSQPLQTWRVQVGAIYVAAELSDLLWLEVLCPPNQGAVQAALLRSLCTRQLQNPSTMTATHQPLRTQPCDIAVALHGSATAMSIWLGQPFTKVRAGSAAELCWQHNMQRIMLPVKYRGSVAYACRKVQHHESPISRIYAYALNSLCATARPHCNPPAINQPNQACQGHR